MFIMQYFGVCSLPHVRLLIFLIILYANSYRTFYFVIVCVVYSLTFTFREDHSENVFSSMATIMTLVLEESEEVSLELLTPLLASVKKDNAVCCC